MDYINFLVAAQKSFTCSKAARCQPKSGQAPAHDAFLPPAAETTSRYGGVVAGDPGLVQLEEVFWFWVIRPWTSLTPGIWN